MLGKLIKYDFKVEFKLLGVLYLVSIMVSGLAGIMRGINQSMEKSLSLVGILQGITMVLAILGVIAIVVGTFIFVVLRYRKNLFKDEGYLMNTLPVKGWQLYVGKLISGTVICLVSIVVAYISSGIIFLKVMPGWDILQEGISQNRIPVWFVVLLGVTVLCTIPGTLTQFYASLSFGYTLQMKTSSPMNKDVLSVLCYIVLYMAQQAVSVLILLVFFVLKFGGLALDTDEIITGDYALSQALTGQDAMFSYVGQIYGMATGLLIVLSILLSVLSIWRMEKHINLD